MAPTSTSRLALVGSPLRTVVVTLDRSPDVGSTIDLPYGDRAVVRHVGLGHDDHGVIIARSAAEHGVS